MSHFGTKIDLHEYYSSNQQRYSYLIVANLEMAHPVLTRLMTHTLFKQLAHIKLMIHTILISSGASGSSELMQRTPPGSCESTLFSHLINY